MYEEADAGSLSNLYVHHDIMLPAFPLALAWLSCHPLRADGPGNLAAVRLRKALGPETLPCWRPPMPGTLAAGRRGLACIRLGLGTLQVQGMLRKLAAFRVVLSPFALAQGWPATQHWGRLVHC